MYCHLKLTNFNTLFFSNPKLNCFPLVCTAYGLPKGEIHNLVGTSIFCPLPGTVYIHSMKELHFIVEEKCQNYDKCRFHDPASFVKLVHPDFKMKF